MNTNYINTDQNISSYPEFEGPSYTVIYEKIRSQQCSEEYLKRAIEFTNIKYIYHRQILSEYFIKNYILNPDYHHCVEDDYITYEDVIKAQNDLKSKLQT